MDTTIQKNKRLFELVPKSLSTKVKGALIAKERVLIGRSENCDVVIASHGISAIHAVIEITEHGGRIYDMNSTNGTYLNDLKIVARDLEIGDTVRFANIAFVFKAYIKKDVPLPVLDALDPEMGRAYTTFDREKIKEVSIEKGQKKLPSAPKLEALVPQIVYPLAADPRAEFSEYIFEDREDLLPIFKYEVNHVSIEVIILFKDKIYSVDYVPIKKGICCLSGYSPESGNIEYAYIGKTESIPFIEISESSVEVHSLDGYKILHLTNGDTVSWLDLKKRPMTIRLKSQDIIRFEKGDLQIYIRNVESPPAVTPAPMFKQDKMLTKYLVMFFLLLIIPLLVLQFYKVDEDLDKEKIPDRIATILYQKPFIPKKSISKDSSTKAQAEKQKSPEMVSAKKPEKVVEKQIENKEKQVEKAGVKVAKQSEPVKQKTQTQKPVAQKLTIKNATKEGGKSSPQKMVAVSRKAEVVNKFKGHVDTYKAIDFSSTISSVLAKSSGSKGAVAQVKDSSSVGFAETLTGGSTVTSLKQADVQSNVGSLRGVTQGRLTDTKGAEGIVSKSTIMTAGIPSDTVVLGAMDPDVIRRILREHIPQFRYCYQRELDAATRNVQGLVKLDFVIGSSGHVMSDKASVASNLSDKVKQCVVNVLLGIQFPEPRGGGIVEVKQPINFYPTRI